MPDKHRILIAGGGYTGLSAAGKLSAREDCEIDLVENSPDLGGLAGGCQIAGTSIEKVYHHIFRTDTAIIGLARELGFEDRLQWHASSLGVYLGGRAHPFSTPSDLLRFGPCSLAGRLRTGATLFYLQHRRDWRGFAAQGARQWMQRACGTSAMRTIWQPLLRGKFDHHADSVSMAWLWARIHTRANSRKSGGEKLGYFAGGFDSLTQALASSLQQRGVRIHTGTRIEQFAAGARRTLIAGQWQDFDACLFTGSTRALARTLPPEPALEPYRTALNSIQYLGAISLVFATDQKLGEHYWLNVNEPDAPFLVFLRHTKLISADSYGGLQVYYIGAYVADSSPLHALSDTEVVARWFAYVRRMFPGFDEGRIRNRQLFRFASAQHIVDTDYANRIPNHRTPLPGVYLANFAQIYPEDRGVNFAVRAGLEAADLITNDFPPA